MVKEREPAFVCVALRSTIHPDREASDLDGVTIINNKSITTEKWRTSAIRYTRGNGFFYLKKRDALGMNGTGQTRCSVKISQPFRLQWRMIMLRCML